ncbi:MAG: HAD-IA family hydrolase [Chloroflexi bacterium]|nr:HAD-IA family hydrolase [Chloroflexota bacterium]
MYRNIIWDLDGTIIDSYPAIGKAYAEALAELGCAIALDEIDVLAHISLNLATEQLAARCGLAGEALSEAFTRIYGAADPAGQPPLAGVRQVLDIIVARGGKNIIITHRIRSSTLALLDAHKLTGMFAGILCGDDGYPRKPAPGAYLTALERYRLVAAETLAVGDRAIDILGAQAAGLSAVLYGKPLEGVSPDYLFGDYTEALRLLGSS